MHCIRNQYVLIFPYNTGENMNVYSLILVYSKNMNRVLTCKRSKNPYRGLYNFIGGKIEEYENIEQGAYRELKEETGISKKDVTLQFLMSLEYKITKNILHVFVGKLKTNVELEQEANPLKWFSSNTNFFNMKKFAGEGLLGHIIEQVKLNRKQVLINEATKAITNRGRKNSQN